jgi:hypothetical protein
MAVGQQRYQFCRLRYALALFSELLKEIAPAKRVAVLRDAPLPRTARRVRLRIGRLELSAIDLRDVGKQACHCGRNIRMADLWDGESFGTNHPDRSPRAPGTRPRSPFRYFASAGPISTGPISWTISPRAAVDRILGEAADRRCRRQ